jgi:predicted  nucleic acid-binding Zn-ribbon protein
MQIKQELDMASQQTNTIRLDRIEEKIDRLTDAMVSIARAEEKINGLQDDHDKMYERINRLSTKLDEIASKVDENSRTVEFIHKLFWVCIVSIAGAIAANVWMIN